MASINGSTLCPGCHEAMKAPILQCLNGHSLCRDCCHNNSTCKVCSAIVTMVRNLHLEQLINKMELTKLKTECPYANKGCKYAPNINNLESHAKECRHREFSCEGKIFCEWKCSWTGNYKDILDHFEVDHPIHSEWDYKQECSIRLNLENDLKDIKIIDFGNGSQVFWCKLKIDTSKQKCYWLFQCVGANEFASQYHYEFEIHLGSTRKLKITEICIGDTEDAEAIFESEKCVCVSFQTIQNFMKRNRLCFRFRIMKTKESTPAQSNPRTHRSSFPGFRSDAHDILLSMPPRSGLASASSSNHLSTNRRARGMPEKQKSKDNILQEKPTYVGKSQKKDKRQREVKQEIGNRLFPLIKRIYPELAGKITGILLELDYSELLHMLEHSESLKARVKEAVTMLYKHG